MIVHIISDWPLTENYIQVLRNLRNEDYPMISGFKEIDLEWWSDSDTEDTEEVNDNELTNLLVLGQVPTWIKEQDIQYAYAPSVKETMWSAGALTKLRYALSRIVNGLGQSDFDPDDYTVIDPTKTPFEYPAGLYFTKGATVYVDIEVSGDIKTEGPETTKLISVAARFEANGYKSWPGAHKTYVWSEEALQDPDYRAVLVQLLTRNRIVLHNGSFDCRWLNYHLVEELDGHTLYADDDTMLMHHSLFQGAGEHGLKPLCQRIFGAPEWEADAKKYTKAGAHYENIPRPLLYRYNAGDVYWTQQLYIYLKRLLELNPDARRVYEETELPDSHLCQDVTTRGMPVDVEYAKDLEVQLEQELETILENVQADAGVAFNPSSPKQVKELFSQLGYGIVSSDEKTLMGLWHQGIAQDVVMGILDYRGTRVARSTFVTSVIAKTYKGRVHPSFKVHGTSTGRLSSSGPNIQNVSNDVEGKPSLRRMYRTQPGRVFVGCDYAQAELRVMAELSNDEAMIAALQEDAPDFFTAMLPMVFPTHDIASMTTTERKPLRLKLKRVVYGSSYGLQPSSVAYMLTMEGTPTTELEAQFIQDNYLGIYPGLRDWRDNTMTDLKETGLLTPFGRRMQMELITRMNYNRVRNQAWAFKPQAIATDICQHAAMNFTNYIMPRISKDPVDGIVAMVHDALYVECKEQDSPEVLLELQESMRHAATQVYSRVPFLVDGHISESWNEA